MNLPQAMTRKLGFTELFLKRNAPAILTGAGVAGFIATTALVARSTAKAIDEFPKISKDVSAAKGLGTKDERTQELTRVYVTSSLTLLKIYYPALLTGSASIICVLAGHNMMAKRQASLVAAYTALDAGFKAYRSRVAEKFGEEEELKLYRSVRTKPSVDEEGQPCEIADKDDVLPSPYARFFDEYSRNWTKTPEYNLMFLRSQQDWANDRLRAYGFVFLNEVYEALGLERSQAGQIVGWKLDSNGDGFVDFGLYQIGDETNRAFVNGLDSMVLLDFNVDGPIRI
jgi:Family of unknown function (DUF6353)